MTKYILSSGYSVISSTDSGYAISNTPEHAVQFGSIGEAMTAASKVNNLLGAATYRAISIEI